MSTGRHIGTLIVVVLKARNLPNKRHIGKQDPYCQVLFNGERRRTKAIKRGGQHPEWDEEIRFELFEDVDSDLPHVPGSETPPPPPPKANGKPPKVQGGNFMNIACFAEDPRDPDLIGEAKVDLTEVLTKGETDEWFTVMNKDKYCGEVYLELTLWFDEPPPVKKATAKPPNNAQYGGSGTFVPLGESGSAGSSYTDLSRMTSSASTSTTGSRDTLPPSLRSASSQLNVYHAPYESVRSHNSSIDGITNEFAELQVQPGGHRRQSMPAQMGSYLPRPASAMSAYDQYDQQQYDQQQYDQQQYDQQQYDYGADQQQPYANDNVHLPDPYQPAYEQRAPPAPSSFSAHGGRPRYSLPPTSSGFMPLVPQPSGFIPLNSQPPAPSGFLPPPSVTPAPGGYSGAVAASRIPSSSFSTMPSAQTAPSGFAASHPPMHSSTYPPPAGQPSSMYYSQPPSANAPPASPYPGQPPAPGSYSPNGSYHQPPPASSYPPGTPPTTYPPNLSYQQPPLQPASAPSHSYPPLPAPPLHQSLSAPPEQPSYGHVSPSPSHDNIPPPPPLTDSPPSSQAVVATHPANYSGYYNGNVPQSSFPTAMPYQQIPPPPPLPGQAVPPPMQSSFSNGSLPVPGPPPPLPPSSSFGQPAPQPPKRRPSLPPPPVGSGYALQASGFQQLPPPPPPPSMPSHMQYEPQGSYSPTHNGQAYYPGPPPRPPQYLPTPGVQHEYQYSQ
ncbi:uncharacterized protein BXZ73DRAFT_87490 [Epithele typhae]|uniref:uncharacterized protein n=1 Tax=Epithele typhae TaxID=378194 RepID=UPI0020082BEA|nr:uncharacterized protein BXZ73DRAFT_87490 [Epithele typhae]KAH9943059.1 hypothetical protein BXZ73DRAFT_87490 [Epithele typhae]